MVTNWTDITTPEKFLQIANSNTGGYFWVSMLFMLGAVLLISLLTFGFEAAILGSAFACFMIGILLAYLGLVGWSWVLMYAGIIIVMILWIMYAQRD